MLGADHRSTLTNRLNLARWREEAAAGTGAAAAYADLLPDLVSVLGEDHPDTLAARHQLAEWQETPGESAVDQSTDS